jgi:hypothetical protein
MLLEERAESKSPANLLPGCYFQSAADSSIRRPLRAAFRRHRLCGFPHEESSKIGSEPGVQASILALYCTSTPNA